MSVKESIMPSFSADFSQVKDREPVPAGRYLLEVVNAEVKQSQGAKTSGTPMLSMHYKVVEGDMENRRVFDNLLLGGNALWRTKEAFLAFGMVDKESAKEQGNIEFDTEDMVGIQFEADVTIEVRTPEEGGNGEPRNRISKYRQISAGSAVTDMAGLFA